jgi:IstB-like ATP binding protein
VLHPGPTLDYLASLEWIAARENLCLVGPAGTGKSHVLVALGTAAVTAGHKVRYFTAADLAETLYRGLADNSVGRVISNLLRHDLILIDEVGFAPSMTPAPSCCSGSSQPPTNAGHSGSPATGRSTSGIGSGSSSDRSIASVRHCWPTIPASTSLASATSCVVAAAQERDLRLPREHLLGENPVHLGSASRHPSDSTVSR